MSINTVRLFVAPLFLALVASAQQQVPAPPAANRNISLKVVVTAKSGPPVAGLGQGDFTLLDNKAPQALTSFRDVGGKDAPVEVLLVIDAVNTGYQSVAYERIQIDKFLRANGGHLAHPMALAVFSDTGTKIQQGFSNDGNAISASLDQYTVGLRTIRRSAGFYGAADRLDLSLKAVEQLAAFESTRPGRKIVLWVSPGWPLLSGPDVQIDAKQQQQIFSTVVRLSNQLREGDVTLYSIDPLGMADAGGFRTFYYKQFLKGISQPIDAEPGNLGLQVLAVQTGGLALNSSNDVTRLLQRCMADTTAYYELSFDAPPAEHRDEYHQIEIKMAGPGLTARTREGYYSQP